MIFAGTGSGAALVRDNGLGRAVDYRAADIAEAMIDAIDSWKSGETDSLRAERAGWVEANASLRAVGAKASAAVMEASGA